MSLKIGIAIPNYGRPAYLKEAVESVLAQTHTYFQLVIVDDRSPDPAVRKYLESIRDPRVTWVINDVNLGTAKNYDKAVRLLDKDVSWALIFDNDDVMDKEYLAKLVEVHDKYPQARVICGHQILVDERKRLLKEDEARPEFEDAETYLSLRCRGRRDLRSSNVFFEMKRFIEAGGYPQFPSGMGTDTVLIFALGFGNRIAYAPAARMNIRVHDGAESITTDHLWEKLVSMKMMLDYCSDVYSRHPSVSSANKAWVLKDLKDYIRTQGSALLINRYREIVSTQATDEAKRSLVALTHECASRDIARSAKFSFLTRFFNLTGCDPESFAFYQWLLNCKRALNPKTVRQRLKNFPPALYIYRHVQILPKIFSGIYTVTGVRRCPCCDAVAVFYHDNWYADILKRIVPPWGMSEGYAEQMVKRENDVCAYCRSNFRTRAHASTVLKTFGCKSIANFTSFLKGRPDFTVYEAANFHLFRRAGIKTAKNYIVSEYHPDVPFGESVNGARNESLEELTFADGTLDLVITSEVLEHVSDLPKALCEIHRVLKKGGRHIFTIPVDYGRVATRTRAVVNASGSIDHLVPPAIHGDDITSGILAFRDFGTDVNDIMVEHGFDCIEEKHHSGGRHLTSVYVCRKS